VKNLTAREKLNWFFGIYDKFRADHGKVCLAGSLETEFNAIPNSLREQTRALTDEMMDWLKTTLAEGRETGQFEFKGDPAGKAALILSSLQGALQMARALGTDKFHAVLEQIKQDLLA
jgi:hypothetical protein